MAQDAIKRERLDELRTSPKSTSSKLNTQHVGPQPHVWDEEEPDAMSGGKQDSRCAQQ